MRGKRAFSILPKKRERSANGGGEGGRAEGPRAPETLNEQRQIFFYSSTQLDSVPFAEGTREE